MTAKQLKFGILGAGSIGSYIGAHLIHAGIDTILVGREKLAQEIRGNGLRITNLTGTDFRLEPEQVQYATSEAALADRDIVLVTLKSLATEEAAHSLKKVLPPGKTVVSFQNGVRNAEVLRSILTEQDVLAGMVPYNVVWNPGAHFHCGTTGALAVEERGDISFAVVSGLQYAGLAAKAYANLPGILWGKLIFNLNNAINALADIPLREELSQPAYRKIIAAAMREALSVLQQSGIRPIASGRMLPGVAPLVLRLPNFLFFRVASNMIKIDPQARSSMWEDLQRGRKTEIDYINGEIVALAEKNGLAAPINGAITHLIKDAEKGAKPKMSAPELGKWLGLA
ncbi:2-dehydropantoate 2-reductase [Scytonema sp. PRP1]|uniref:2-dehydropantoate 2-reductase n=1 Tax=Scytonema sp. PRP1 TaxID=3120513 RepID=UPI002FD26735